MENSIYIVDEWVENTIEDESVDKVMDDEYENVAERKPKRQRSKVLVSAIAIFLVVVAVVASLAATLPKSRSEVKLLENSHSGQTTSATTPPDAEPEIIASQTFVPAALAEASAKSLSTSTLSAPMKMILTPYLQDGLLNDTDLSIWQEVTAQFLEAQMNCSYLQIIPLGMAQLAGSYGNRWEQREVTDGSLLIEFQVEDIDDGCWVTYVGEMAEALANNTADLVDLAMANWTVEENSTMSEYWTFDKVVERITEAWATEMDTMVYIALLQVESEAFMDVEDTVVFNSLALDLEEAEESSELTTSSPTLMPSVAPSSLSTPAPTIAATVLSVPPTAASSSKATSVAPTGSAPAFTVSGSFELLQEFPHDPSAYTQGLELVPGNPQQYVESTGLYGRSTLRRVDLASGFVLQQVDLASSYFGEGVTHYLDKDGNDLLIQLTWKEGAAFIYNATDLTLLKETFINSTTSGEAWGICYVASKGIFYVTDGSEYLHTWNASTLELIEKVPVTWQTATMEAAQTRNFLNELEYDVHSGTVLANVWQKNDIVRINPETGFITHRYDLTELDQAQTTDADVLNGIAITSIPNEIWVTGKLWSSMYMISLSD